MNKRVSVKDLFGICIFYVHWHAETVGQVLVLGDLVYSLYVPFHDYISFPCARGRRVTHDDSWF